MIQEYTHLLEDRAVTIAALITTRGTVAVVLFGIFLRSDTMAWVARVTDILTSSTLLDDTVLKTLPRTTGSQMQANGPIFEPVS